jgi:hypothetical protein
LYSCMYHQRCRALNYSWHAASEMTEVKMTQHRPEFLHLFCHSEKKSYLIIRFDFAIWQFIRQWQCAETSTDCLNIKTCTRKQEQRHRPATECVYTMTSELHGYM